MKLRGDHFDGAAAAAADDDDDDDDDDADDADADDDDDDDDADDDADDDDDDDDDDDAVVYSLDPVRSKQTDLIFFIHHTCVPPTAALVPIAPMLQVPSSTILLPMSRGTSPLCPPTIHTLFIFLVVILLIGMMFAISAPVRRSRRSRDVAWDEAR